MTRFMPVVLYVFAALTIAGGAMGTIVSKNHEPWSILGSLAFGLVAVAGGVLAARNPKAGLTVGLIDAALFVAFFAYRYAQSGKPMPAFPSIGMGAIVVVLTLIALSSLRKATS